MEKTKEEILEEHNNINGLKVKGNVVWKSSALNAMDEYTAHLTDQIKSMEEQVKELRKFNNALKADMLALADVNKELRGGEWEVNR